MKNLLLPLGTQVYFVVPHTRGTGIRMGLLGTHGTAYWQELCILFFLPAGDLGFSGMGLAQSGQLGVLNSWVLHAPRIPKSGAQNTLFPLHGARSLPRWAGHHTTLQSMCHTPAGAQNGKLWANNGRWADRLSLQSERSWGTVRQLAGWRQPWESNGAIRSDQSTAWNLW